MRGMTMRQIKLRQQGKLPRIEQPKEREQRLPPDGEYELEEPLDEGLLVDQGDGMRVVVRGPRRDDDERSHELPDEPPKGWCEG